MPEVCPYCSREFANTKALGSHVHYMHEAKTLTPDYSPISRSGADKERFQLLLENCLSGTGLPMPSDIERIEETLAQIPHGISDVLDRYRNPFSCAVGKEKMLKETEEILEQSETE